MPSSLDTTGLSALYASGETILFPHAHAARLWRSRLGKESAPSSTPPLAWHEWTAQLWSNLIVEGLEDRLLLNRLQEQQLWLEVLRSHPASPGISPASQRDLARLARSGLQRAAAYRTVDRVRATADTADSRAFGLWLHAFIARCDRDRLLAPALVEEALASYLPARIPGSPTVVHLVGFEQMNPAQQYLMDALASSGVAVHRHALWQASGGARQSIELSDSGQQLRFAVRLLRDAARLPRERAPRFAVICPQPGDHQHELERLFRELLAPELESVFADLSSTPWHFSTPGSLHTIPSIADGLDLLRWTISPLSLERVGQLILSPFLGGSDPAEDRARFKAKSLPQLLALRGALDLTAFLALLSKAGTKDATQAAFSELSALAQAGRESGLAHAERSAAEWSEQIRKLLLRAGWPGPRALSPIEYEAIQAWEGLLDTVATLQFDGSRMTFASLLDLLSAEASTTSAPAANRDAPVQVLTLPEADGLLFDLAIHLDATDEHLPRLERLHPLLSQTLQRSLGLGDPAQAMKQTKHALQSLIDRSGTVFFLAAQDGAEAKAKLTSLAANLHFTQSSAADLLPAEPATAPLDTEPIADPQTIPIVDAEGVRGGVEILRNQAACGFHAFATHRLAAADAATRSMGIDARESGSLLHKALELLWAQLGSSDALRQLRPTERQDAIKAALEAAFSRHRLFAPAGDAWTFHYLAVLRERFTRLLTRWLELELERSPFTVLAQEQEQSLTLGPLRLQIRPDRIDQVAGGRVFVDYKTSYDLSSKHWLEDRLEAPQLPAYALAADPATVKGISFAQIRPGEKLGWISLSENAGLFPRKQNKAVQFAEQLPIWQEQLTELATAFARGEANVDPKTYPHTCQYCPHRILCRLDPESLLDQAEDADDLVEEDLLG